MAPEYMRYNTLASAARLPTVMVKMGLISAPTRELEGRICIRQLDAPVSTRQRPRGWVKSTSLLALLALRTRPREVAQKPAAG